MKIFVAGGTGVIGRPMVARLLAKGHDIVALTRSQEEALALEETRHRTGNRRCF